MQSNIFKYNFADGTKIQFIFSISRPVDRFCSLLLVCIMWGYILINLFWPRYTWPGKHSNNIIYTPSNNKLCSLISLIFIVSVLDVEVYFPDFIATENLCLFFLAMIFASRQRLKFFPYSHNLAQQISLFYCWSVKRPHLFCWFHRIFSNHVANLCLHVDIT